MSQPNPLQYGHQGEKPYSPFYKHSGKITLHGTILAVLAGLLAAVIVGYFYAYADLYSPVAQLNALLALLFGIAIGGVAAMVMRWGKVRNLPVALAIVTVLTIVAYYIAWVCWVCVVLDRFKIARTFSVYDLAGNPSQLWDLIQQINEVGTFSTGSSSSSTPRENEHGTFLWFIWAAEAATIFASALGAAHVLVADRPFCEKCECWATKAVTIATLGLGDRKEIKQQMIAHNFDWLIFLGRASSPKWTAINYQYCPTCKELHTVSVVVVTETVKKRGGTTKKQKTIVKQLLLSAEEVEQIRGLT